MHFVVYTVSESADGRAVVAWLEGQRPRVTYETHDLRIVPEVMEELQYRLAGAGLPTSVPSIRLPQVFREDRRTTGSAVVQHIGGLSALLARCHPAPEPLR